MPRIPSPNDMPPFAPGGGSLPSADTGYVHPAEIRRGFIPMVFQITSPLNRRQVLMPHALVLHVNPLSFQETQTQKVERFQTRGGWQEQHWGSDLTELSADATTGAFMNIYTGLTSVLRQRTIAWDRYRDLVDLFHNNGSVHDPFGNIVLQGGVLLIYDRGTYMGTFRSFETQETDETPFSFKMNWSFKVEQTLLLVPTSLRDPGQRVPSFQEQNTLPSLRAEEKPLDRPAEIERLNEINRERAHYLNEEKKQEIEESQTRIEAENQRLADETFLERGIRESQGVPSEDNTRFNVLLQRQQAQEKREAAQGYAEQNAIAANQPRIQVDQPPRQPTPEEKAMYETLFPGAGGGT